MIMISYASSIHTIAYLIILYYCQYWPHISITRLAIDFRRRNSEYTKRAMDERNNNSFEHSYLFIAHSLFDQ